MPQEKKGAIYQSGFANPFLPLNIYIPDTEPKVFDGRVYVYGSKDLFGGEYCCYKYHVYSASIENLQEWTDHGPVLASRDDYEEEGIKATISWSDGLLWAPDVVKRGDKYYLYFCQSDGTEGVAESEYPYGPFENPRQIMMDGKPIQGIDPSVLEHDGEFYYTWGQGHCHMAKLNDDMCTLDGSTYAEALISSEDGQHGFHEGSSLRKIGDWFCIVYASEYTEEYPNRGGRPTKLDYAVSKDIYGPYERKGTIINNDGIDPETWNNHGSIVKINHQWYVFYHGSSNNCKYTRRARVEKINVDEEKGIIAEVPMTSMGFADSISPCQKLEAAYAYKVSGGAYFTQKDDVYPLIHVKNGCAVSYRYLDFSQKEDWRIQLEGELFQNSTIRIYINEKEVCQMACNAGEKAINGTFHTKEKNADLRIEFSGVEDVELLQLNCFSFS